MNTIHLQVANLRSQKGVSQRELADALGISYQSISKWETGVSQS